ncbi:MAG: prepilin-type N-terminal cleavage/methylation domain-containing protein [candidate division WOR-3 bacterium]
MRNKGFTLVELLVVIFIIGILISFLVPPIVSRVTQNARITVVKNRLYQLRKAIVGEVGANYVDYGFKGDVGRFPRHLIELATNRPDTLREFIYPGKESIPAWNPFTKKGWNGPYVRDDPEHSFLYDPWGTPIMYYLGPNGETLGLKSAGPDGEWYDPQRHQVNDDIIVLF